MNDQKPIYVVRTNYNEAVRCKNTEEEQTVVNWIKTHSSEFAWSIWCESITEDQLLADYSKPAEDYQTEAEALEDDYVWDDYLSVWLSINILSFEDWNVES